MKSRTTEDSVFNAPDNITPNTRTRAILLAAPVFFIITTLVLRTHAGPFWMWYSVDPGYFYLFDSLRFINLMSPGHVAHPGIPVQVLGALVIKAVHLFENADAITTIVLADPERYLHLIGGIFLFLNFIALVIVGLVGYRVFGAALPAVMLQTAPFLSTMVIKHAINVKPEPLLMLAMIMACIIAVRALRPGALEREGAKIAISFGIVAGFAVASKVSAAPVFLFPVFLLGSKRLVSVYGIAALVSFFVFILPGIAAAPEFFAWAGKLAIGSGDYGAGAQTIIDPDRYVRGLYKLVSRPIFHLTLLISLVMTAIAWRRRGRVPFSPEARLLAGICLAQIAQVIIIAKQPTAYYMIPAWMLVPLAWVLLYRLSLDLGLAIARRPALFTKGVAIVLIGLGISQSFSIARADREFREKNRQAHSISNDDFSHCARIYTFAASSPAYAFYLGDFTTDSAFAERLGARIAANDFWFNTHTNSIENLGGVQDIKAIADQYSCLYVRGLPGPVNMAMKLIRPAIPEHKADSECYTGSETIRGLAIDCRTGKGN